MTDDLLAAVRDLPKCSKYLHVPVQSGSNAVLKRMKRGYTVEDYREMLARTYESIPGVAVTSDFIVGFCGETDEDFDADGRAGPRVAVQEQLHLQIQRAARHQGSRAVRRRRARRRQAPPQQRAAGPAEPDLRRRQPRVPRPRGDGARRGSEQDRPRNTREPGDRLQLTGRTNCDRIVVFEGNRRQIGRFLPVVVYDANAHTLFGEIVTQHVGPEVFGLVAAAGRDRRPKRLNGICTKSCYNGISYSAGDHLRNI